MSFADKLRTAREGARLSQSDLGQFAGLDKSRISRWESGRGEPTVSQAIRLAKGLGVSLDYLADDEIKSPPVQPDAAERQALKMVRAMRLSEEEVIDRLTHDPRAFPEVVVDPKPRPKRSRRA